MSRIVYREAPEYFRLLRTVDHSSKEHQKLNAEYEDWETKFKADYKKKTVTGGTRGLNKWRYSQRCPT